MKAMKASWMKAMRASSQKQTPASGQKRTQASSFTYGNSVESPSLLAMLAVSYGKATGKSLLAEMVQLIFELSADGVRRHGTINLAHLLHFKLTPSSKTLQITPMVKLKAMLTDEWWVHRNGPPLVQLFRGDIRRGGIVHWGY